jgi:hypothetical protein
MQATVYAQDEWKNRHSHDDIPLYEGCAPNTSINLRLVLMAMWVPEPGDTNELTLQLSMASEKQGWV